MRISNIWFLFSLCLWIAACASPKPVTKSLATPRQPNLQVVSTESRSERSQVQTEKEAPQVQPQRKPETPLPEEKGPEIEYLAPSKISKPSQKRLEVTLDLENADLLEFLDLLFTKTLQKNYVVDPLARAKVTVHLKGRFSESELIRIINKVLELQNITIVAEKDFYRVTTISKLGKLSGSYNFAIIRPRHLQCINLLSVTKSFVSSQGLVIPDKQTNSLIIIDIPANLRKIIKIITLLDRNILEDLYLEVYHPKVISAEKLADYLKKIFTSAIFKLSGPQNFLDFVPIKELNVLLILSKNHSNIALVKRWLEELDTGETTENQVFVYYVENGDAEEIAKILQDAFSEVKETKRETIVQAKTKKPTSKITRGTISGKVKIIPDKTNNLLIITASREDYQVILNLLKDIDIVPRQVLIEVLIAEISLNKTLEYGVEWWIKTNFNLDSKKYVGNIVSYGKYGGIAGQGFSFTVYRGVDPRALITALEGVSEVHILSNPVILATDNKEARIQIGKEIPTVTQKVANTASSNLNVTQSIQYRDTGIILEVKPHINSSGLVKLDITQEVSEMAGTLLDSPIISKRKMQTSLVVQDGHTVILGGLIKEKRDRGESGIPGLRKIPLVGHLFKWGNRYTERTELLVAITPRVVRNTEEAEIAMREFKARIEDLKRRLSQEFQTKKD